MDLREGLGGYGRAVCSDGGANGHEEAIVSHVSICQTRPSRKSYTYPNVAAEPAMYWPSVRSMPLGPGPKRTMFVKPSLISAIPGLEFWKRTEYEANDQADGASHHAAHLDYNMLASVRRTARGAHLRLSNVEGPCCPCGMELTGTGMFVCS